jgi:hypothetical protein
MFHPARVNNSTLICFRPVLCEVPLRPEAGKERPALGDYQALVEAMEEDDILWDGLKGVSAGKLKHLHKVAYKTLGSGSKGAYTEKFEKLRAYAEEQLSRAVKEGSTSCQKYFPHFHDTTSCVMAALCPCGVVSSLMVSVSTKSVQVELGS